MNEELNREPAKQEDAAIVEPGFYKSWYKGLRFLKESLLTRSKLTIAFFAVCIFDALGPKIPGVELVEIGLLFFIAHDVIQRARAEKEGRPVEEVVKEAGGAETRMFFNSAIFGVCFVLSSLLLIAPGIWFVSRASLAIIFVSVERKGPIGGFLSSFELTKGHFKKTLTYMFFAPISIFLVPLVPYFGFAILMGIICSQSNFDNPEKFFESIEKYLDLLYIPLFNLLQISIYTPMYDLYWYYKKLKEEKEAVST